MLNSKAGSILTLSYAPPPRPPQEIATFLLSEEARDLRPVLVTWVSGAADLVFRDRVRKALALLPSLAPRIPLLGIPLPAPPPPPVFLPGVKFP